MRLCELKTRQKYIIKDLDLDNVPMKLVEMGCFPGCEAELVYRAPLGDPCCYKINGFHLCIRRDTAQFVRVEAVEV